MRYLQQLPNGYGAPNGYPAAMPHPGYAAKPMCAPGATEHAPRQMPPNRIPKQPEHLPNFSGTALAL